MNWPALLSTAGNALSLVGVLWLFREWVRVLVRGVRRYAGGTTQVVTPAAVLSSTSVMSVDAYVTTPGVDLDSRVKSLEGKVDYHGRELARIAERIDAERRNGQEALASAEDRLQGLRADLERAKQPSRLDRLAAAAVVLGLVLDTWGQWI